AHQRLIKSCTWRRIVRPVIIKLSGSAMAALTLVFINGTLPLPPEVPQVVTLAAYASEVSELGQCNGAVGGCGRTGGSQPSYSSDPCNGAVGGCPNLYVVPVLSPGDTLEAHGLTGNGAPLWSMAGATRSLPDEQLWGEVKAATDLACYNREVD